MTQLLISVKNVEEAMLALDAGADIVDLKDPNIGALGALDLHEASQIVKAINGRRLLSATVGEDHTSVSELIGDINSYAKLSVDIIKIVASKLFYDPNFFAEISKLTNAGVKIVAVFFADGNMDLTLLERLQNMGFYGAMLDTKNKQFDLLALQTNEALHQFIQLCNKYHLKSGLAGSLKPQYIDKLIEFNSIYIGFRGGVCENSMRQSALSLSKVIEIKNMLRRHNKLNPKAQEILGLALHS
jgi:dihydroneopterin aldolase